MILVNMPILTHVKGFNPVLELLYKNRAGIIDNNELEKGLEVYRNLDNRKELEDSTRKQGFGINIMLAF